jgi:hypothetical protein
MKRCASGCEAGTPEIWLVRPYRGNRLDDASLSASEYKELIDGFGFKSNTSRTTASRGIIAVSSFNRDCPQRRH